MNSKMGGYLGLARRANYLIIGSDSIKNYNKKLYLIIASSNCGENVESIAIKKSKEYGIPCIISNEDISNYIGISNCKIVALKNKGLSEAILNCKSDYQYITR